MKIRAHLTILVLGAIAPLLFTSIIGGVLLVQNERDTFRKEAIGRVRAAMSAIDSEVRGHTSTMLALASSVNLQTGDLRAFHAEAQRVLASQQPEWRNIGLATIDRKQLIDANRPYGEQAVFGAYDPSFDAVISTRKPAVGGVSAGPSVPTVSVRLRVPVIVTGEVRYVMSVPIDPAAFQGVLAAQRLPADWRIALAGRDKTIITRIPALQVGAPISKEFANQLALAPEGWFRGLSRDGDERYVAYVTSALTGWAIGTAVPANAIDAAMWRTIWLLLSGVLIAIGISFALAALIARRIEDPIEDLVAATRLMPTGAAIGLPVTRRIEEVADLHEALHASALAIKEREALLERERRTLREQAQMLDLAHDAIIVRSVAGVIKFWSDGAQETYGWTKNEAVGRVCHELLHTQFSTPLHEINDELDRRSRWEGDLTHKRKDGSPVKVSSRWALHRGAEGNPGVVLEINFDLTRRLRAEQSIAELNEQLREENRRKDRFLATLAHELRNPLAPIRNCVTVLKATNAASGDTAWAHDVIARQVTQMTRLLDDLLDVSRITHGKLQLKRERVSLKRMIDTVVETCRPQLSGHQLILEIESRPVELEVDPVRFEQIVANLINNAAKYSDDGTRVWLRARAEGSDAVVTVTDEGIGISSEMLPCVFEIFTQASAGAGRAKGGMGIGLALVRALVELHGGSVEAKSAGEGRGSEFVVRLTGAVVAEAPAAPRGRTNLGARIPATRFVVADDLVDSADSLAALLRQQGHEVQVAYDGEQACAAVEKFHPRVALLDLGMPGVDGYEAARRIRAQPWGRDILLIALSGWGQREDRMRTRGAGFDYHLVKPLAYDELDEILRIALGEPGPVVTLVKKDVA